MDKESLISALAQLGYRLFRGKKETFSPKKILDVLAQLGESKDIRLIESFPVVLATCGHLGITLDFEKLLSRSDPRGQKRGILEKLLLASSCLLEQEGFEKPEGLDSALLKQKKKYGNLLRTDIIDLGDGISVSTERLTNTLRRYGTDLDKAASAREREKNKQLKSFQLDLHLSILFSAKQKELVLKKFNGAKFSKTEQEYYSRVVKKKLEALTNSDLRNIASTLTRKKTKIR